MAQSSSSQLRERVLGAAESALKRNGSVGPLELLQELGYLYPGHVNDWRKGVPHYTPLEPHIQCGAAKLAEVYRVFALCMAGHVEEAKKAALTVKSSRTPDEASFWQWMAVKFGI